LVIKANHVMLYGGKIAAGTEIHIKHISTICTQNIKDFNVRLNGT
jgi:hypothetical protein